MANPVSTEQFVNWLTGKPMALYDATGSIFNPSGSQHTIGLVPDPGSTPGTTKFLREDGTWAAPPTPPTPTIPYAGFIVNGKITESHASNNVTYSLKTIADADPSSSDPVYARFPDGSALTITAALSLTINSGTTVGTSNATAFNLWLALVNNSGSPLLAVRKCSNGNTSTANIIGYPSNGLVTTSALGNSSFTSYASSAVTSKPYILLGYVNYESGLTTAGTWDASPTNIVNCTSGVGPYPGQVIQFFSQQAAGSTLVASTALTDVTGSLVAITPLSKVSLIYLLYTGQATATAPGAGANSEITIQLFRDSTGLGTGVTCGNVSGAGSNLQTDACSALSFVDFPQTTSSITYRQKQKCLNALHNVFSSPFCLVKEILG